MSTNQPTIEEFSDSDDELFFDAVDDKVLRENIEREALREEPRYNQKASIRAFNGLKGRSEQRSKLFSDESLRRLLNTQQPVVVSPSGMIVEKQLAEDLKHRGIIDSFEESPSAEFLIQALRALEDPSNAELAVDAIKIIFKSLSESLPRENPLVSMYQTLSEDEDLRVIKDLLWAELVDLYTEAWQRAEVPLCEAVGAEPPVRPKRNRQSRFARFFGEQTPPKRSNSAPRTEPGTNPGTNQRERVTETDLECFEQEHADDEQETDRLNYAAVLHTALFCVWAAKCGYDIYSLNERDMENFLFCAEQLFWSMTEFTVSMKFLVPVASNVGLMNYNLNGFLSSVIDPLGGLNGQVNLAGIKLEDGLRHCFQFFRGRLGSTDKPSPEANQHHEPNEAPSHTA